VRSEFKNIRAILTLAFMLMLCAVSAALGQQPIKPPQSAVAAPAPAQADKQEDESRQIYFDYAESRPKKKSAAGNTKAAARRARRYLRKTPKAIAQTAKSAKAIAQHNAADIAQVGITIWKLRPSGASDEKETRILDQEETSQNVELTPVRIEAETRLQVKDKVRLSIESQRAGYLYVIDRELYADGTMSEPYLIFPTLRTRGGDNKVQAGMLVDIPAQEDRPNYFTMKPSRPDQVGEVLTVLVTPQPLDVPPLQRKYMRLPEGQVSQWERDWKAEVERFEMEGGAGQAWTKEEKAAGSSGTRLLDQEDPAPQTIYRVAAKRGHPVVITVPLRYTESATSSKSTDKSTASPK
jgi:hypothetical protein